MALTRRHAGFTLLSAWAALFLGPLGRRLSAHHAQTAAHVQPSLQPYPASPNPVAQDQAPRRREFTITARNYSFTPNQIEVAHDDVVRIEVRGEDQPHGFAIDEYRISRRVLPGATTAIEFRADRVGTFAFYCGISTDPGCRAMRGTFVVRAR